MGVLIFQGQGGIEPGLAAARHGTPLGRAGDGRRFVRVVGLNRRAVAALVAVFTSGDRDLQRIDRPQLDLREDGIKCLVARAVIGPLHAEHLRQGERRRPKSLLRVLTRNVSIVRTELGIREQAFVRMRIDQRGASLEVGVLIE